VHLAIRRRCPHCKRKFTTKSHLARHLRRLCARKPFQCDRCRKRSPERDWLAEHKVWHFEVDLDRYLQVVRHLYAYPCFYCATTLSAADVRTHILTDHIKIGHSQYIKKASDDDDAETNPPPHTNFTRCHRRIAKINQTNHRVRENDVISFVCCLLCFAVTLNFFVQIRRSNSNACLHGSRS
jgi:uncharacterized Zn-finger protein